jgi:hypothetical protein
VAEARAKKWKLLRDPRLWGGFIASGLVLGATCPLWPEPQRGICTRLSVTVLDIGLGQLGLKASGPASSPDGGTP